MRGRGGSERSGDGMDGVARQQLYYSVEQVADLLGLHVRTVRGYVREGRLKAALVGRQYRITPEDLEAFTGLPTPSPARAARPSARHTEVSGIVQIDAIGPGSVDRLTNLLMAAVAGRHGDDRLRVESVHDRERATLKIIVLGGLDATAELLRLIDSVIEDLE
ncbi:helix-turn-helix domain-containing protein [Streptomyces lavendulae]|uniref:helix-turn-helix domain-containing protein n=1 Tax=Streptomyces lavendulae TaxID=1914 RepID=UPI00255536D3|nr:helix-turn-helix domain-containing protein [Streptomyces lavendulae]